MKAFHHVPEVIRVSGNMLIAKSKELVIVGTGWSLVSKDEGPRQLCIKQQADRQLRKDSIKTQHQGTSWANPLPKFNR